MKQAIVVRWTAALAVILTFIAGQVYAAGIFIPHIENHGPYKPVPSFEEPLLPLRGHVPAAVRDSRGLGAVELDAVLELSIVLSLNHEVELDRWLLEISDPTSPHYRQYLSRDDFVARYGPTAEQVGAVQSYLEANGMVVTSVEANRLIIHASGRVADINAIFNTEIHHFHRQGETFYAPIYELQVDGSLPIHSVHGLENHFRARSYARKLTAAANRPGLTPAQIKSAYSLSSTLTGAGQTLALFELDGYDKADITAYEQAFNLPKVPLKNVLVDGFTGSAGEGAGEVTLDIELMIALAPGAAQIIVYEGPNTASGVLNTYNRIATDNLASSVSSSWGASESYSPGSLLSAEGLIFKQMAAQGQSIFAASGDSDAYDDGSNLTVDDPASQPFVVGVGGTTLRIAADGSYLSETTWSSGRGPGNEGGGGGISSVWSLPAWQQGVLGSGSGGSTTRRNVPDVALDSDPRTGYAIFFDGQWQVFGGTSCAAPLWAALTALANQKLASVGHGRIGFLNPALYQLNRGTNYTAFMHDINDHSDNGYYPAVTGYDLATGWGTPYIDALIAGLTDISAPPPQCVLANPSVTLSPSSQTAQPGQAALYTLNVVNNDSSLCAASTFTLSASLPSGLTASFDQSSVTLQHGQSAAVMATVTSTSSSAPGTYNFSIAVANAVQSSLNASAGGSYVIAGAPTSGATLTISPLNGSSFSRQMKDWAKFKVGLSDGKKGVASHPVSLTVVGPDSWSDTVDSGFNGTSQYWIYISPSLPAGSYTITGTSDYQGSTLSGQTVFTVY